MPAHPLSSDDGLKDAATSTLRELLSVAKRYRLRRRRLDTFYLFTERHRKKGRTNQVGAPAGVSWDDSPEMELMLKHRDSYEQLDAVAKRVAAAITDPLSEVDPMTLNELMRQMTRLESQRDSHLEAIQILLQQLSRELIAQEQTLTKIVAEGAKLAQLALINREKLQALAEERNGGITSKSTTELEAMARDFKQKIANGELFVIQEASDDVQQGSGEV